jgi:hypothetical protein
VHDGGRGLDWHPADGSNRADEGGQKVAPLACDRDRRVSAPSTLRRLKAGKPYPAEMTHHAALVPREESFTGDANAREQEVERSGATLPNPYRRASAR